MGSLTHLHIAKWSVFVRYNSRLAKVSEKDITWWGRTHVESLECVSHEAWWVRRRGSTVAREVYTAGGSTEGEKSVRLRVRGKS